MTTVSILTHLAQAVAGAQLVMLMRNDTVEELFGIKFGRSAWCLATMCAAAGLIGLGLNEPPSVKAFILGAVALGLFAFILTAPHGQTLDGPQQKIPYNEDDITLEAACWLTDVPFAYGATLGWPCWLTYNFLGVALNNWTVALCGLPIVFSYWPLAYLPEVKRRWDTRFFGAWTTGFWLFLGL
jgi:hypothetical protein